MLPGPQSVRSGTSRLERRSLDPAEAAQFGARVRSQVAVLLYTGDNPIPNTLGRALMCLSGVMSYAY
jgi:hypothetical protein